MIHENSTGQKNNQNTFPNRQKIPIVSPKLLVYLTKNNFLNNLFLIWLFLVPVYEWTFSICKV